ncbi:hypothetical protein ABIB68_005369 [Bradyrhizobium sp. F1.2.2]
MDAAASGTKAGPGRDEPREVLPRVRTNGANALRSPLGEAGRVRRSLWAKPDRCVRQNRVVLAVVATVKPCGDASGLYRVSMHRQFARRRRQKGTRRRGERGISRQPTAQGLRGRKNHNEINALRLMCPRLCPNSLELRPCEFGAADGVSARTKAGRGASRRWRAGPACRCGPVARRWRRGALGGLLRP